jgi:hypothetical protein
MRALSPAQQQEATVATDLPTEVFAAAFRDNLTMTCQGISYERLTQDQQAMLVDLVTAHVGRIRPGHAEIRLDEVKAHLHKTWCDRLDDNCGKLRSAAVGLSCRIANGGNSHDRHACPLEARRSR